MRIEVNGERVDTEATNLALLCEELGYGDARVATARNGAFVPVAERPATPLTEGDSIEIVAPRQGG